MDDLVRRIGDDLMEAVIDMRRRRPPMGFGKNVANILIAMLGDEGDDRGRASRQRRSRAADEAFSTVSVVGIDLIDMAMGVHAAGHDQQAVRIEDVRRFQPMTQRGDLATGNADIRLKHIRFGDDRAATDNPFELHVS